MNLDIIPNGAIKRVHVSQNDVGRTLTFELFNNSTSYTVPSGAVVKIQGTKPSGFGFSETCTVSGNTVTVDTTETMTDEYGYIDTELQISNSGNVIGTSNFVLAVEKNPHPSNTTDGTQITAQSLQVQINQLAEIIESGGSGLTDEAKQALLNCFAHVAWIDEHGQDYYDALEDALYPPATLTSISAVYTQSGTVYDTDSLDDLKTDLVVTARYSNGTTQTITNYTLSGTLTEGTSVITVSYGGKTTTFNVTVTTMPYVTDGLIAYWDAIENTGSTHDGNATKWIDKVEGYELPILDSTTTWDDDAIVFTGVSPQGLKADAFWEGLSSNSTIEVVFTPTLSNGTQLVALLDTGMTMSGGYYDSKLVAIYSDGTIGFIGSTGNTYTNPVAHTSIRKAVATYSNFDVAKAYVNGTELSLSNYSHSFRAGSRFVCIGSMDPTNSSQRYQFNGKIHAIRVYDKQLSAEELNKNLVYDNTRFSLGLTL